MKFVSFFSNAFVGLAFIGSMVSFASCSDDNDEDAKIEQQLKHDIIGKWKLYQMGETLTPTDRKSVTTYQTDGKCYISLFLDEFWSYKGKEDYSISGRTLIVSHANDIQTSTLVIQDGNLIQSDIKNIVDPTNSVLKDVQKKIPNSFLFTRVTNDFSSDIIGLWEGVYLTGDATFGAADHRWEFKSDGTYVYYTKSGDAWVPDTTNTKNIYNLDGDYLGFYWIKNGVTYKEWWDIGSCNTTKKEMIWYALREKADGTQYTTSLLLKKIVDE